MIYLVIAAVLWGSSFPVISYALGDISPMLFLALRFSIAFVIVALWARVRDLRTVFRRDLFLISIPNAVSFILQFKGQELTTASKMALFVNSAPIFVVPLGVIFLRERFARRQIAAMVVAIGGVIVTTTGLDFSGFHTINFGDIMGWLVGLSWAVFIVFSGPTVKRYSTIDVSRALYFWTAAMTLPFVLMEPVRFTASSLPAVAYLAVFTTVIAYFLYLRGVRSVSSLATSIIILIEVVVAFIISHFLLGETFTAIESVGVVMVLAGVVLVLKRAAPKPRPSTASHG